MRMADRHLIPSAGTWTGEVTVGDVSHKGIFEVFDSNGAWVALFRKTLLTRFKAVHDYNLDTIKIPKGHDWAILQNQHWQEEQT
jgi:hypothetical protein